MSRARARREDRVAAAGAAATAAAMVDVARITDHRVALARTVRQASPLLLDALAMAGAPLSDMLDRLAEPSSALEDLYLFGHRATKLQRYYGGRRTLGSMPWVRRDASASFPAGIGGGLTMVRAGPRLGLCGSIGRLRLATAGAHAWLRIEDRLPQSLALAMVGRPVDALLDHSLLNGRDYTVVRCETDVFGSAGTALHVRTGLRRCRTPWSAAGALDDGVAAMAAVMRGAAAPAFAA